MISPVLIKLWIDFFCQNGNAAFCIQFNAQRITDNGFLPRSDLADKSCDSIPVIGDSAKNNCCGITEIKISVINFQITDTSCFRTACRQAPDVYGKPAVLLSGAFSP